MKKRSIAGMLTVMLAMQSLGSIYGFGEVSLQVAAKSQTMEQVGSTPTPLPVTIGKKVPDAAISTEGISTLANSTTASTKKQFMRKLHDYMNARKKSFTIVFKGSYQKIYNGDIEAMFSQAWGIDDKNTSDDFDYLLGNIDTYRFKVPTYSQNKSIFQFTIKYRESAAQLKKVNKKVKSALKELELSGKSRVEKARLIHNYIAEHFIYDEKLAHFSVYDGLVRAEHVTVCQGYALLYYKMCTEAGVPCRFISGYGYSNGTAIPHAWNIVKIGSKWYHVDPTWDDTDGVLRDYVYDYFLIGSTQMLKDHALDSAYKTSSFKKKYPVATQNYDWSTPKSTSTPKVTATPKITATPKVTTTPRITSTPKVTGTPRTTSTPKVTGTPRLTPTPKVTPTPRVTATAKVTTSPRVSKAPEGTKQPTATPGSATITRLEYYQELERSYKEEWQYDTVTGLKKFIDDRFLESLHDIFLNMPDKEYETLAKEYAENIQKDAEDKMQNGSVPYLESFLTAFMEEWNTYMTDPMDQYSKSAAYKTDLDTYKKGYPALSEKEVELKFKLELFEQHYTENKNQLEAVVLQDAERILQS